MADPITVPIVFDPVELAEIGYDFMRANIPGWDPARGDPDARVIAACAQIIAEGAGTASDVPLAIDRYEGRWVDGLPPLDATSAQTTATVTALDALGYTIADGTRFEVKTSGDEGVVFFTVGTVTIPPASTSTATSEVVLVAETPGAAGSGLAADSDVVPVDSLAWIDTVTLEQITTGGRDAETDDEYHARWVVLRALSNDTPILAKDAAALIQALIPGVGRTLPLDNYDPVAQTFGNEKYVTVAAVNQNGDALGGGVAADAEALIEARREINFVMNVIGANYATIAVSTAFVTYAGFDLPAAEDAVEAALSAYFEPAVFSTPPNSDSTVWVAETHVYLNDIIALIEGVEPVRRVTSLTIGQVQLVTGVAATDVLTITAHGRVLNDPVLLTGVTGGAPLVVATTYYARDITTNTFKLSLTPGGAAINLTTDLTIGTAVSLQAEDCALPQPAPLTRPGPMTAVASAP